LAVTENGLFPVGQRGVRLLPDRQPAVPFLGLTSMPFKAADPRNFLVLAPFHGPWSLLNLRVAPFGLPFARHPSGAMFLGMLGASFGLSPLAARTHAKPDRKVGASAMPGFGVDGH
jgi:hypothetical protein